jgi:hypothetical protein
MRECISYTYIALSLSLYYITTSAWDPYKDWANR